LLTYGCPKFSPLPDIPSNSLAVSKVASISRRAEPADDEQKMLPVARFQRKQRKPFFADFDKAATKLIVFLPVPWHCPTKQKVRLNPFALTFLTLSGL
jgi:hypothetical protein